MTDGLPEGVGELVYEGPNVMMGYAEHPRDLALAAMPPRLRTGDLARALPDGLFEVVGRRSRFTKVFGLRVNLDEVEAHLATNGVSGRCLGVEGSIDVFVTRRRDVTTARDLVAALCGVPTWVVRTPRLRELPLTPNGKTYYRRLADLAEERPDSAPVGPVDAEDLDQLYAGVLDRDDVSLHQRFADLGADSLSCGELAVRLRARVDSLPREWHRMPFADVAGGP